MSIEELLLPRYKLLADYPLNILEIGAVFDRCTEFQCVFFDKYPHLFRKLEWWEERKIEDMTAYVKLVIDNNIGFVHKVEKWSGANIHGVPLYEYKNKVGYQTTLSVTDLLPATESEYNEYISKFPPT